MGQIRSLVQDGISIAKSADAGGALKSKLADHGAKIAEGLSKTVVSPFVDYVETSARAGDSLAGSSYEILAVKAYDNAGQRDGYFFNQLGFSYFDHRKTVNLGIGYRQFMLNKKLLFGVNSFYDHEFPNDHKRWGFGFEAKSSIFGFGFNRYLGLSDYREDRSGTDSKALDGMDIRAELALPYFPGAKINYNYFAWEGDGTAADLSGEKLSLRGQLFKNLTIDAGRTFYKNDARDDDNWVKISFTWALNQKDTGPSMFQVADTAYSFKEIDYERYRPVRRENKIIKQKEFSAQVTGN